MASGGQNNTSFQAQKWTNLRAFTVGNTAKNVDGTSAIAWTLNEILGSSDSSKFYRGDKIWSNIIKQTANAALGIDTNLKIGTARKDLNFDIANGSGTGINDGYAGGITWGNGTSAYAGIYYQSSGSYGTRLIFGTTGSYADGAKARMIIQSTGYVGIGTLSPDTLLTVNGNAKATKFIGALQGNADTATKLSNTPNNTTTFLRGDNTWSNAIQGDFIAGDSKNSYYHLYTARSGSGGVHHEMVGGDADYGVVKIRHLSTEGSGGPGSFTAALGIFDERTASLSGSYQPTLYIKRSGNVTTVSPLFGIDNSSGRVFTIDNSGAVTIAQGNHLTLSGAGTSSDQWIKFADSSVTYFLGIRRPATTYGPTYYDSSTYHRLVYESTIAWNIYALKDGSGNTITSKYVTLDTDQTNITGSKRFTKAVQCYRYTTNNNLPAITMDKPGSNYVGIGADGTSNRIKFGPCTNLNGDAWVEQSSFNNNQWFFQGRIYCTNTLNTEGDIIPAAGKRVGGSGGALYIGNSDNQNWVYIQDICSHSGNDKWKIQISGAAHFTSCYGAVWNDYAEMRNVPEAQINILNFIDKKGEIISRTYPYAGLCVCENGNGSMKITNARLQKGCKIISDTFGFCIGETENCKTPIAVTGRVLAYPYENIEIYKSHIGDFVCSGPNGTISIMSSEEAIKYPECIVGTISEIPAYTIWYCGNKDTKPINVNGRIWIYVR